MVADTVEPAAVAAVVAPEEDVAEGLGAVPVPVVAEQTAEMGVQCERGGAPAWRVARAGFRAGFQAALMMVEQSRLELPSNHEGRVRRRERELQYWESDGMHDVV